jgi:hypothetical protein
MYALTDYLANLDKPRASREMDIFRGIAANPKWSNRYVSMFNGATEPGWLMRASTLLQVFAEAQWQKIGQAFTHGSSRLPKVRGKN